MGDSGCHQTLETNCTPLKGGIWMTHLVFSWNWNWAGRRSLLILNCTRGWLTHQSLASSRDHNQLLQSLSFQSCPTDSGWQCELWGSIVLSLEHFVCWHRGPELVPLCATHNPQDWILELWVPPSSWFGDDSGMKGKQTDLPILIRAPWVHVRVSQMQAIPESGKSLKFSSLLVP